MLSSMRNRGTAIPEQFVAPGVLLATRRFDWEVDEHGWRGSAITVRDDWVVAVDGSLYYLADLRRNLGRFCPAPGDDSSGSLVVAALRAWGDRFARFLEGDFAIIAWHRPSGRVLVARDFVGKRSLAFTVTRDRTLVVASSPRAVTGFPGVSSEYDVGFIASSVSGLHGHGNRTAFADVSVVPGGGTLAFENGTLSTVDQWSPPPFSSDWEDEPSDQAADRLRYLIEEAVAERFPDRGTASVWMSGGWDSTSVFASGRAARIRRKEGSLRVWPISLRYPEGDTGDESAFIESIARRWGTDPRWLSVDHIRLFEDADRRASVRDDPRVHPFESQIRSLCQVSRELGIRVVHDGAGGDHLFTVSSAAILADHLRSGRLAPLWTTWKEWGRRNAWTFARSVILPQFSGETLEWIGTVRGRPLPGFWDSPVPPWVRLTPALATEARPALERDAREGISAWETRDVLTTPLVARAMSWNHAIALEEGILLRSPLFDRRVIEFAASRPLNERLGGPDSKVLLRRAMRDLLPAEVLMPRRRKTGTPVEYFRREMTAEAKGEFMRLFGEGRSHLDRLEIIDAARLKASMDEYQKEANHALGAALQQVIEAERWLAAQALEGYHVRP